MQAKFDPSGSVAFDLSIGRIELSDGDPYLLVPASAIAAIAAGQTDTRGLGRAMGVKVAARVARRLAVPSGRSGTMPPSATLRDALRQAPVEAVAELLGGELALLGLGSLRLERWGQSLVFAFDPCALDPRADALLLGVLEGALSTVTDRDVATTVLERVGRALRVFVGNPRAAAVVSQHVEEGASFTEALRALHEGEAPRDP